MHFLWLGLVGSHCPYHLPWESAVHFLWLGLVGSHCPWEPALEGSSFSLMLASSSFLVLVSSSL